MRINRSASSLSFRAKRTPQGGCLPYLAVILLMTGTAILARDWLIYWLVTQHAPSPPSLRQAEIAFASGDLDTAITMSRELIAAEPKNYEALAILVRALIYRSYVDYRYQTDRQSALSLTTEFSQDDPFNWWVQGLHAFSLHANGKSDEANRLALRVIQRDNHNLPARIALALSYSNQGLFEAALREAQRAVELAEDNASWRMDAKRALAIAYSDLGRYPEAIQSVQQAIALNRRMIPLHFERALYELHLDHTSAATAAYFQVIAFDEQNAKARLRLCELSSQLRELEAALSYCQTAVELSPIWWEVWYRLGREYFLQGKLREAQQALHRCSSLQISQNVPMNERQLACWYWQGQAAEALGDCEGLLATYHEFQAMVATANLPQTWTYPPEGPTGCSMTQP